MVELLIAIQATLCAAPLVAVFFGRLSPISAPVLVAVLFSHVYVAQPILLLVYGHPLLTEEMMALGLAVSIIALVSFYAGWLWSVRHPPRPQKRGIDLRKGMVCAVAVWCVGALGWGVFILRSGGFSHYYSAPHGAAGDWLGTSAYVYALVWFMPAAVSVLLGLVFYSLPGAPMRRRLLWLAAVLSSWYFADSLLSGSRGDFFAITSPWLIFMLMSMRKHRQRVLAGGLFLLLGGAMFQILPSFRDALHLGGDKAAFRDPERWEAAFSRVGSVTRRGQSAEFDNHCANCYISWRFQEYGYGQSFINPIINFLPRHLVPNKAEYMVRAFSAGDVIEAELGWTAAYGSCPTGPGRIFTDIGFFSILFWVAVGLSAGRFDWTVHAKKDAGSLPRHATMMIVLMYLVLQSYSAGFMKLVYVGVPVGLCLKFSRRSRPSYCALTSPIRADFARLGHGTRVAPGAWAR
ncbi:MAG: hypothetical protein Q8Q12_03105 [bacterium]|nr:hypothetical protein [bacterium]